MDKQELFDKAVDHLFAQGRLALKDPKNGTTSRSCLYRAPGGLKCAAGFFIPDEKYSPDLENRSASHESVKAILDAEVGADNIYLLSALQDAHDLCDADEEGKFDKAMMADGLRGVARRFSLSPARVVHHEAQFATAA